MGRTPCCDSKGIKKGPWAPEEDKLLVDYVQANGPGNWRILPKLAGTCSVCSSIEPARPLGACVIWPFALARRFWSDLGDLPRALALQG